MSIANVQSIKSAPTFYPAADSPNTTNNNQTSNNTDITSAISLVKAINSGQVQSLSIRKDSKGSAPFYRVSVEDKSGDTQSLTVFTDQEIDMINQVAQQKNTPITETMETHYAKGFFGSIGKFFADILKNALSAVVILGAPLIALYFGLKHVFKKTGAKEIVDKLSSSASDLNAVTKEIKGKVKDIDVQELQNLLHTTINDFSETARPALTEQIASIGSKISGKVTEVDIQGHLDSLLSTAQDKLEEADFAKLTEKLSGLADHLKEEGFNIKIKTDFFKRKKA